MSKTLKEKGCKAVGVLKKGLHKFVLWHYRKILLLLMLPSIVLAFEAENTIKPAPCENLRAVPVPLPTTSERITKLEGRLQSLQERASSLQGIANAGQEVGSLEQLFVHESQLTVSLQELLDVRDQGLFDATAEHQIVFIGEIIDSLHQLETTLQACTGNLKQRTMEQIRAHCLLSMRIPELRAAIVRCQALLSWILRAQRSKEALSCARVQLGENASGAAQTSLGLAGLFVKFASTLGGVPAPEGAPGQSRSGETAGSAPLPGVESVSSNVSARSNPGEAF